MSEFRGKRFKDRNFQDRFKQMGDLAEGVFEDWATANDCRYVRYGLNRPPLRRFALLPSPIRYTPDFIVERPKSFKNQQSLTEVKGVGEDGIVKIKVENWDALCTWEELSGLPVTVFVFDSYRQQVAALVPISTIYNYVLDAEMGYYHDGGQPKPYYKMPVEWFTWETAPGVVE